MKVLTIPIRSPPNVVKEVEQDESITRSYEVKPYSERDVTDRTDGPPVINVRHRGPDHPGNWPMGCTKCSCEVAKILRSLHQGVPGRCGYCVVKRVLTLEKFTYDIILLVCQLFNNI